MVKEESFIAENSDEPFENGINTLKETIDSNLIKNELNTDMNIITSGRSSTRTENKSVNSGHKEHRVLLKISPDCNRESPEERIKETSKKVVKRSFPLK